MAFSLIWLPDVLKAAGLKVSEVDGWQTRGRSDIGAIKGVICHHTAGPRTGNMPSLKIVTNGRPDLQGPLSQLCLGRDGTFFIVAAGRANHAGKGEWKGLTAGNTSFIGIEAENTGTNADFPWPARQMEAYQHGVAAILKHIKQKPIMCCGHKEFRPRAKIDPLFDMNVFRLEVEKIMTGITPALKPISKLEHFPGPGASAARPTLRRLRTGTPSEHQTLVAQIQAKLKVDTTAGGKGNFGAKTEAEVRAFQSKHGIVPDGIVGPITWAALDGM